MAFAAITVRTERIVPSLGKLQISFRGDQTFGDSPKGRPNAADIERCVQVSPENLPVPRRVAIGSSNLGHEEEIGFAEICGEFLDRAAEASTRLLRHVLERIETKPVAVGKCDPVFVAACQVIEGLRPVEVDVPQFDKIGAAEFRVWVVDISSSQIARSGPRVVIILLQL